MLLDVRMHGQLTADAPKVLETVDDYMQLVEVALSHQTVRSSPALERELHRLHAAAGLSLIHI